jgi:transposase-like protein
LSRFFAKKGCGTDRALKVAIAEMYLQGVSTRRVATVMERLCGMEVTSCQVSRLTSELDAEFELWGGARVAPMKYPCGLKKSR